MLSVKCHLSTDELPVALNGFCLDFQHWLRLPLNGSLSFPGPPLCHLCAKCIDHHSVCSGRSPTVSPDIRRKATSGGELNKTTTFVLTILPPSPSDLLMFLSNGAHSLELLALSQKVEGLDSQRLEQQIQRDVPGTVQRECCTSRGTTSKCDALTVFGWTLKIVG